MTAPAELSSEAPVAAPAARTSPSPFGLSAAIAVAGVAVWGILAGMAHMRLALVGFGVAAAIAGRDATFARTTGARLRDCRAHRRQRGRGLLASQYAMLADAVHVSFFYAVRNVPMAKIPHLHDDGTRVHVDRHGRVDLHRWSFAGAAAYCRLRPRAQTLSRERPDHRGHRGSRGGRRAAHVRRALPGVPRRDLGAGASPTTSGDERRARSRDRHRAAPAPGCTR